MGDTQKENTWGIQNRPEGQEDLAGGVLVIWDKRKGSKQNGPQLNLFVEQQRKRRPRSLVRLRRARKIQILAENSVKVLQAVYWKDFNS